MSETFYGQFQIGQSTKATQCKWVKHIEYTSKTFCKEIFAILTYIIGLMLYKQFRQ